MNKKRLVLLLVPLIILFVLQVGFYFNYSFESAGSKCSMTKLSFSSKEQEIEWEKQYEECVNAAKKMEIRHSEYKNYEKGIMVLFALCSVVITAFAMVHAKKYPISRFIHISMYVLCFLTSILALIILMSS